MRLRGNSRAPLGSLILFSLWSCALGSAQTYGELQGSVVDPSAAAIVGAQVRLTNTATNQQRTAATNEVGAYRFPFLVPGVYDVNVQMEGFQSESLKGLEIQLGDAAAADFELGLGDFTTSLEVTASPPLLQTQDTSVGVVIENRRITELPINGRTYTDFIKLAPNVTAEMSGESLAGNRQGGERANQPISIAGQRQQFNRFTLDGVENTDVNFNTFVFRPSIDALQEFKVQSGVYSAQYGRATAQINATTKSGSNEFHGTVFLFHRNENLDAAEWRVQGEKNPFVRNQSGFTLGGPLIRNRFFFLANFEALRDRKTLEQRANVATARMRSGDLSASGREVYDQATRLYDLDPNGNERAVSAARFPNDAIPASRFDPVALQLLEFYPEATRPGDDILSNYVRDASRPIDWDQFLLRADWQENANSSWFGRYAFADELAEAPDAFPTVLRRTITIPHQAMASNTRTFGPALVNDLRIGYNRFNNDIVGFFANRRDVSSELPIVGLPAPGPEAWGPPSIGLADGLRSFGGGGGPFVNRNQSFQALDNVSWVRGKHSIKFGGEIRRDHFNQKAYTRARGSFGFDGKATFDPAIERRSSTGHSFADYLLGWADLYGGNLNFADVKFRSTSFSLYAEDAWRLHPRLTVTLGLRYELTPAWRDRDRGIMNAQMFDPGVGDFGLLENTRVPIMTRPGEGDFYEGLNWRYEDRIPVQAGDQFMGPRLVRNDHNDLAPRIGIAYSPSDRWTIRTGAGVFYAQDTGNPRFDMGRNLAADFTADQNIERPDIPLSDPLSNQRGRIECSGWEGACVARPFVLANVENRRTPYVAQWMLNLQRQLTPTLLLEAGYQGSAGSKLERMRAFDASVQRTGADDRSSPLQRQPWPVYFLVQAVDGSVSSNYNAVSLKLQQRFSSGLTYLLGYTVSKSIDNGSAIRANGGDVLFPANPYDFSTVRSLSQFHTGRRFVASFLYELPWGPGRRRLQSGWASKILGGWQIGGIVTFSDGTPVDVHRFPVNATGVNPNVKDATVDHFWDPEAFFKDPALDYTYTNVGRNVLIRPGLSQWDFSLLKQIPIVEGHQLQFRFEAFNFTNHPNWLDVSLNPTNPGTFGRVTSARTMRELQFGLKYLF